MIFPLLLIVIVVTLVVLLFKRAGLNPLWVSVSLVPFIVCALFKPELMILAGFEVLIMLGIFNLCLPILALRAWVSKGEVPNPYFFSDPQNMFLVCLHFFIPLYSLFIILKKLEFNGLWCLLGLFPPAMLILLWVLAFKGKVSASRGRGITTGP